MTYPWFKVDTAGWLEGSIRVDLTAEQRSVWIDLLALASRLKLRDGTIRYSVDKPMPRGQIAAILNIPQDLLDSTIDICVLDTNKDNDQHRIEIWPDGTIQIVNWEKYQSTPVGKSRDDATSRVYKEKRNTRHATVRYPDEALDALVENVGAEGAVRKLQQAIKDKQARGEIEVTAGNSGTDKQGAIQ